MLPNQCWLSNGDRIHFIDSILLGFIPAVLLALGGPGGDTAHARMNAPSLYHCIAGVASGGTSAGQDNIVLTIKVAAGQSLVVYHKTIWGPTAVRDSQGNQWTDVASVGADSGNCLDFDYVLSPRVGSDTVTMVEPGPGGNNSALLCTVESLSSIQAINGEAYTAASTALSGAVTPPMQNELLFGVYHVEAANPAFSGNSINQMGAGIPRDVPQTAANDALLIGGASEAGVQGTDVGFERNFTPRGYYCGGIVALAASSATPTPTPTPAPISRTLSQSIATLVSDIQGVGSVMPSLCAAGGTEPCANPGSATLDAAGDGVTDDTAAFTNALAAGDVSVPGNKTYLINGNITMPSYRTLQCQPGAVLKTTNNNSTPSEILNFSSASFSYVIGCAFQGAYTSGSSNPNYAVYISGGQDNTLVGNTFVGFPATSAVVVTGGSVADVIALNDFEQNYDLGVETINASDTMMALNRLVDSSIGNMISTSTDTNADNHIGWNYQKKVAGNGVGDVFLTGNGTMSGTGFSYGSDNVISNVMRSIDNFYSDLSGLTLANYQTNQSNPSIPAPITQSGGQTVNQDFNAVLGFLMDQAVPSPLLNSNPCGTFQVGASCGGHTVVTTGGGDNTAALQYWLNQGDVLVAPGTYDFNGAKGTYGRPGVDIPDYRTLQCEQGATLNETVDSNYSLLNSGRIASAGHVSVIGCHFQGPNFTPGNPAAFPLANSNANAIWIEQAGLSPTNPPHDYLIFGNTSLGIPGYTFGVYDPCGTANEGAGWPCYGVAPAVNRQTDIAILFNYTNHQSEWGSFPAYGIAGGGNIHVAFSHANDGGFDIESDNGTSQVITAFMDHNLLTSQYAYGDGITYDAPSFSCGANSYGNYTSEVCWNNIVSGVDTVGQPCILWSVAGPTLLQNQVLNGAVD